MATEAPPYQYMVLHENPTGITLFPWAKQWMKDRFGRGALERKINGLQKYGWEVVSMAGGSTGFLFLVVPKVTVLLRRRSDYQWDEDSLEQVKRLLGEGQKIPAIRCEFVTSIKPCLPLIRLEQMITRTRIDFDCSRFNSPKPTPVGCDRLGEANPSITQAARDSETAESLGQNRGVGGPSV